MPKYGRGQYLLHTHQGMHVSIDKLGEFFENESPYGAKKEESGPLGRRSIVLDVPVNKREDRSRDRTKRLYIDEFPGSVEIRYQWRVYNSSEHYRKAVDYIEDKILQHSSRDALQTRQRRRNLKVVK